jgi:hypothetical protein
MTASPALLRLAGLDRFTIPEKRYPTPLPPALEANYCYTIDGGHSILVVLANEYREGEPVADYLTPAAVRTVLRQGYTVKEGPLDGAVHPFVWSRIPYSSEIGLLKDAGDIEY